MRQPSPTGFPRVAPRLPFATWVAGPLLALAIVAALVTYKTGSALRTLAAVESTHTFVSRAEALPLASWPAAVRPLMRSANYVAIIWPALVFGILIGAAVRVLIPCSWLMALFRSSPVRSHMMAGVAGAPLMLCSCCVAPVFAAVHERTRQTGPATALLLAAPSLNPAALALTFMLFSGEIAFLRLAMAVALVFGVSAVAARYADTSGLAQATCPDVEKGSSPKRAIGAFGREVGRLAATTLPLILGGIVLSSILLEFVHPGRFEHVPWRIAAVVLTALVSVPVALPTFAEIPLALGLLSAGLPAGAALALLVAGPAINLPSLLTLRRMTNARYAITLALGTFALAALAGLLV